MALLLFEHAQFFCRGVLQYVYLFGLVHPLHLFFITTGREFARFWDSNLDHRL